MAERRKYRTLPDGKRVLVRKWLGVEGYESSYTSSCTGCTYVPENTGGPERGAGCKECGYTGKRRTVFFVPFDEEQYERALARASRRRLTYARRAKQDIKETQ